MQRDVTFDTLLQRTGCTTTQDPTATTARGSPHSAPLQVVEIDMETMTDAFMTAVALAAVAQGTTKIMDIATREGVQSQ